MHSILLSLPRFLALFLLLPLGLRGQLPPLTGPSVELAYGSFNFREVTIHYTDPVDASAEVASNYTIATLTVSAVTRLNPRTVRLTTSQQEAGLPYVIQVDNVKNEAANTGTQLAKVLVPFTAFPKIRFETDFSSLPPKTHPIQDTFLQNQILKLTDAARGKRGTYLIEPFDGQTVYGVVAQFKVLVGGGNGGDGFSFNAGANVPFAEITEEGAGTGVIISFDTFKNPAEAFAPAIDVKFNNAVVASRAVPNLRTGARFVDVVIQITPGGMLDLIYDGDIIFKQLLTYTIPNRMLFGFGSRTGDSFDNHWIDDLIIGTILQPVTDASAPELISLCADSDGKSLTAVFSEPVNGTGENKANYSAQGLVIERVTRLDAKSVRLETTGQSPATSYTLQVSNVQDSAANPMAPTSRSFAFPDPSATYFTDFCSLDPSSALYGNARLSEGILQLTDTNFYQIGNLILPDLNNQKRLEAFTVDMRVLIQSGTAPRGQGMALSFGNIPNTRFGNEGAGDGLIVRFDTQNSQIVVFFQGELISLIPHPLETGTGFVDVKVQVKADGRLDLFWGTSQVINGLLAFKQQIPGRFALSGSTGQNTFNARHWVDSLRIVTTPVAPDVISPKLISSTALSDVPDQIQLVFSEPMLASSVEKISNYKLSPGVTISSVDMDETGILVTLQTSEALLPGVTYQLSLQDLLDRANTPNDLGPNTIWPNPTITNFAIRLGGPELLISRDPNGVLLSWEGDYLLESSPDAAGPYLPISGDATSPHPVFVESAQQFFRLRQR